VAKKSDDVSDRFDTLLRASGEFIRRLYCSQDIFTASPFARHNGPFAIIGRKGTHMRARAHNRIYEAHLECEARVRAIDSIAG
jgi:hypothetical protein